MPIIRYSFKRTNGHIIGHLFMAANEGAVDADQDAHARICPSYGPALEKDETIDIDVEVDTLPEFDEESLEEFLDLDPDEDEEGEEEEEAGGEGKPELEEAE